MHEEFLKYQAQTSHTPLAIEIDYAQGSYIVDKKGKHYLDFIAGVSANVLGHGHPCIKEAIVSQLDKHSHVMVYGEFIQASPLALSQKLASLCSPKLQCTYLTNSGTEATEAAIKLAKRHTGRYEIIAAHNAYHGNSQGAMSVCGKEVKNSAFRPLIPGSKFIQFNSIADLAKITKNTAAVILETIQGAAGFITPQNDYLKKVKEKCDSVGALLILDEIQTGIGRTGCFFGFENYDVIPDMVIAGKGLGGGMPIGALLSSKDLLADFQENPRLGHITTFGGHPVIAAAALATIQELTSSDLIPETLKKEKLIRDQLVHPKIKAIRGKGLMLALIFENDEIATEVILKCLDQGLLLFWLLFEGCAVRITPPLTISNEEILEGCEILINVLNSL